MLTDYKMLPPSQALALLNKNANSSANDTDTQDGVATSTLSSSDSSLLYFGLQLGGLGLLLNDSLDKEIVSEHEICEIPDSPQWFKGYINLRSQVVPVFDLYDYLNLKKESSFFKSEYLLIIGRSDSIFAISVTTMPQKISINKQNQINEPPPYPEAIKQCCSTSYRQNGLWSEWDIERFISQLSHKYH